MRYPPVVFMKMPFCGVFRRALAGPQPTAAPLGQRHVNAALGRQRSSAVLRDASADRCVEAAAQRFGSEVVSAAHDLMVLSVERRWGAPP